MFNKTPASETANEPVKLNQDQQDKLRSIISTVRTDSPRDVRATSSSEFDTDEIIDQRIDMDAIRARGLMKYSYNYAPPANVERIVETAAVAVLSNLGKDVTDAFSYEFGGDNEIKAKVIMAASTQLNHSPTNSRLLHLKSVRDVIDFFKEPVSNVNQYTKLARSWDRPTNVHVMEQPVRFHPEDTEAWHGGVTAFPGTGGEVLGLRNKRLVRQYQPKKDWFDYEDQTFEYSRPDSDMPWDSEIARRMDRYPDKRYNLSTKTFTRAK